MLEIIKAGEVVARSQNLRGLLDYPRRRGRYGLRLTFARHVSITRRPDGSAHVFVVFDDGAECRTEFASFGVAVGWFKARRSWGLPTSSSGPDYHNFSLLCGDSRY